jgi:MFS family permease
MEESMSKVKFNAYIDILKKRNFALYITAGFTSTLGTEFSSIAILFYIYSAYNSLFLISIYKIIEIIPVLALGLVAGVFVDKWGKTRTLAVADILSGLVEIPLIFYREYFLILVIALLITIFNVFHNPARNALLAMILRKEELMAGNGLTGAIYNSVGIIGAPLAIILLDITGYPMLFFIDAISYIISGICFYNIKITEKLSSQKKSSFSDMFRGLKYGLKYVKKHSQVLLYLTVTFVVMMITGGMSLFLLVYTEEVIHYPVAYGLVFSMLAIAEVITGLISGFFTKLSPLTLTSIGIVMVSLGFFLLGLFSHLFVILLFGLLAGIGSGALAVSLMVGLQSNTDAVMLGRVFSIFSVVGNVGRIISFVFVPFLLALIGLNISLILVGILLVLVILGCQFV